MYMCTSVHMYLRMYVCMCICMYMHVYVHMYVCKCAYTCMWVYVCVYAYMCAHARVIHVYAYISEHGSTNYPQPSTMATTTQVSTQNLLQTNSPEYQQHLTTRNRIAKILHHQNNIKMSKTIPKQYRPPSSLTVIPTNTELQEDFNKQLQDLFFQHLDKVILHNTIALELENARLQELTHHTKRQHPPQQEPTPSSSTIQTEAPPLKRNHKCNAAQNTEHVLPYNHHQPIYTITNTTDQIENHPQTKGRRHS